MTDIETPEVSGKDAVFCIRELRPDVPLIIMTGFSEEMNSTDAGENGMGYLMKPFTTEEISEAIQGQLDARPEKSDNHGVQDI